MAAGFFDALHTSDSITAHDACGRYILHHDFTFYMATPAAAIPRLGRLPPLLARQRRQVILRQGESRVLFSLMATISLHATSMMPAPPPTISTVATTTMRHMPRREEMAIDATPCLYAEL